MVLDNPSMGQSAGFQQAQVWNFLGEATRNTCVRIRGLIVYHQDLGNFRLVRQRRNARRDDRLLVAGGNNDRDGAYSRCRGESSGARWIVIVAGHILLDAEGSFPD